MEAFEHRGQPASNPSGGVAIIDFFGPWYGERFSGVGPVI